MRKCTNCGKEVKVVQVPDEVGKGLHEEYECPDCGIVEDTEPVEEKGKVLLLIEVGVKYDSEEYDIDGVADGLTLTVNPAEDSEGLTVTGVHCLSATPVEEKVYCPCCGKPHNVRPVAYRVDKDEKEAFDDLKNYNCKPDGEGLIVQLPSALVEAGPWNGDRYLAEYTGLHYECTDCNKMFAVQG